MRPPTPPSQPSSSASVPALKLRIEPSRLAWWWWGGLHALLAAAVVLLGAPAAVRLALLVTVACHAALRRPRATPSAIAVEADGSFVLLEQGGERLVLGSRTLVCPLWVRLDLGTGPRRRNLLLFADQLAATDWARLRAVLHRTRGA